jgi:hypothetical protein
MDFLGMMGEGIGWVFWITATGREDGRVGRYTCWLVDLWGGLALAALRILRGEVSVRGVVPPEGCFDPLPFFEGLRQYRAEKDRDKPLIGETMEWLS